MDRGHWVLYLGLWLLPGLLFLAGVYYLLPQRIFIHYLRENNNAQFKAYLALGRWKIPFMPTTQNDQEQGLNLHRLKEIINISRPYRKHLIWKKFILRIDFGLKDPAFTGIAAGGAWALGGAVLPLLYRCFRFERKPEIRLNPGFQNTGLKVDWVGELAAPIWLWIKLWSLFKKGRRP